MRVGALRITSQSVVNEAETAVDQTISLTRQWLETTRDSLFIDKLWKVGVPESWEGRGISIYFFDQDSLLFWVNNLYSGDVTNIFEGDDLNSIISYWSGPELLVYRYVRGEHRVVVVLNLNTLIGSRDIELKSTFDDFSHENLISEYVEVRGKGFWMTRKADSSPPLMVTILGWLGMALVLIGLSLQVRVVVKRYNAVWVLLLYLLLLIVIRIGMIYLNFPDHSSQIFGRIFEPDDFMLLSMGNLLVSFVFIVSYTIVLYRSRFKLEWSYKRMKPAMKLLMVILFITFIDLIVAYFHYAMVSVIYTTNVHVDLYNLLEIDIATVLFYMVGALFITTRMILNYLGVFSFANFRFWFKFLLSMLILTLILLPLEPEIRQSGYILLIFHAGYLLIVGLRKYIGLQGTLIAVVAAFAIYMLFFSMVESSSAMDRKSHQYSRLLTINNNELVNSPQFDDLTWARVSPRRIELKSGNSINLQQLAPYYALARDTVISVGSSKHFITRDSNGATLIVTRHRNTFFDAASTFAYIFIAQYLVVILILYLIGFEHSIRHFRWNMLTIRIRIVMVGLVTLSTAATMLVIIDYTYTGYEYQHRQIINNATRSLLGSFNLYIKENPDVENPLTSWFTARAHALEYNVNIFDAQGNIIVTTQDKSLFPAKMSGVVYQSLHYRGAPYHSRYVKSSKVDYASTYFPIYNRNQLLGYINIRMFNAVGNTKNSLLGGALNVFAIVLLVAILLSLSIYRMITRPLSVLHRGMKNIAAMEKLPIEEGGRISDEVKLLVQQYNTMIDYLAENYQTLARSEREGAWREMARQVAHEIKNPLTPMRLKIQMLQRARYNKIEGLDQRTDATLQTLLEQIDLLSQIADEFSNFAKLKEGLPTKVSVNETMESVIEMYRDNRQGEIRTYFADDVYVFIDRGHFQRVLINICQNALQAIENAEGGLVEIRTFIDGEHIKIEICDNGLGISDEVRHRIFEPNFTTKSSGSGLGLAISRQIIVISGGSITFQSPGESGRGTTFTIELPINVESV